MSGDNCGEKVELDGVVQDSLCNAVALRKVVCGDFEGGEERRIRDRESLKTAEASGRAIWAR